MNDTTTISVAELELLKRFRDFVLDLRDEPLAFWSQDQLGEFECTCCGREPSHISAYPVFSNAIFARQIILWCADCGFGFVPNTSFSLADYYTTQYAIENRGDRQMDPVAYFTKIEESDPPKNLARYGNRARDQIKRIKILKPKIGSMLDVGAGPGYALYVSGAPLKFALEQDEYSQPFLDYIGAVRLDWCDITPESYDVVLLSHSLEHFDVVDVLPRLTLLTRALKKGGILYIEVPPGGLGWKAYNYKHEPHTLFFTSESLHKLISQLEMEIISCGPLSKASAAIGGRKDPIYAPPADGRFSDPRGRLTLIAQKPT